jgi:hypothetical protein
VSSDSGYAVGQWSDTISKAFGAIALSTDDGGLTWKDDVVSIGDLDGRFNQLYVTPMARPVATCQSAAVFERVPTPLGVAMDGYNSRILQSPVSPEVAMHPNPATGSCDVEIFMPAEALAAFALTDLLGRPVSPSMQRIYREGTTEFQLDLGSLPQGMYLGVLTSRYGRATRRVQICR